MTVRFSKNCLVVVFAMCWLLPAVSASLAQSVGLQSGGDAEQVVGVEASVRNTALRPGDTTVVVVKVNVSPGYHIQSNAPTEDWVIPTKLNLEVPEGWKVGTVSYPEAEMLEFSFAKGKKWSVFGENPVIKAEVTSPEGAPKGPATLTATVEFQACDDKQCLPPGSAKSSVTIEIADKTSPDAASAVTSAKPADTGNESKAVPGNLFADVAEKSGWLVLLGWVYAAGLGLSLTPCVFPLIPITLGYFRNQASESKKRTTMLALAYVAGIGVTYSTLGVVAASTGALFGSWLSSPLLLVVIAVIIGGMALSMFGLYDLRPPAFIASRSGAKAGLGGAFAMGLVFGIVAAPCTGPATIALLAFVGALGEPLIGLALFFCLAMGLSTPLLLLAIFSGNLPASGVWMVWVKKLLGVLMLGAAIWLLTPVIGSANAAIAGGVFAIAAAVWIGLIEKSGFKPGSLAAARTISLIAGIVIGAWLLMPKVERPGIEWEKWSDERVTQARSAGQPVLIDFSAEWCAPCHELEAGAFKHPEAVELSEQFVRLKADVTDSRSDAVKKLLDRYDVRGVPAVLFIGADGSEIRELRIESNVPGVDLVKRLSAAAE